jgi:hypothetical protein
MALFRWIFRRPVPVPPGTQQFHYSGAVTMVLTAFIVVSALEIPILELILPWEVARIISLIVGFYGLFWMIGLLATMRIYPHLVDESGIQIRGSRELTILWCDIRNVRERGRSLPPGGKTQFEDGVLSLGMAGGTTVDVVLSHPMILPVKKTAGEPVTEIRFHADAPGDLVAAAQAKILSREAVDR